MTNITLPKGVHRTVARGREYFTFQAGRGTKRAGPRVKLPSDPQSPEFWAAVHDAQTTAFGGPKKPEARRPRIVGKHVYLLRDGDLVKIGYASSINRRISHLQTSSPRSLTLLGVVRGGRKTEQMLHRKFRDYRVRGEWFRIEAELAAFIEELLNEPGS
jgi:hypothetical protein